MIVYGLSADPPTDVGGHGSVVRALRACEGADEVRVTPVYAHAYAEKRLATTSYEARVEMCALAFEGAVMDSDADVGKHATLAPAGSRSVSASDDDAGETSGGDEGGALGRVSGRIQSFARAQRRLGEHQTWINGGIDGRASARATGYDFHYLRRRGRV